MAHEVNSVEKNSEVDVHIRSTPGRVTQVAISGLKQAASKGHGKLIRRH